MAQSLEMIKGILASSRCVVHIDLEQVRLGISGDRPLAVRQWFGLIAVNYAARRHGIQRHISPIEARKLCPDIRLVHVPTLSLDDTADCGREVYHENPSKATHKASLAPYRRASSEIMQILQSFTPNLQKASVDEAYLDITDLVNSALLKEIEENSCTRAPIDWEDVAALPSKQEELSADALDTPRYWRQRQLHQGAKLVSQIRQAVFDKLGYTCSAGIAHNKILAKIGSALHKPNQQTVFPEAEIVNFLTDFPVSKVPGLGGKLGDKIQEHFGDTVGSVRTYSYQALELKLGLETADFLFNMARGIHHDLVSPVSATKSLTAAKSLQPVVTESSQLEKWVKTLCGEVIERLLNPLESQGKPERWPRSVSLSYFNPSNKDSQAKSKTSVMPSYQVVESDPSVLWKQILQLCQSCVPSIFPCSRLAITVSGLEPIDSSTRSILSFFKTAPRKDNTTAIINKNGSINSAQDDNQEKQDRKREQSKSFFTQYANRVCEQKKNQEPIIIDLDTDSDSQPDENGKPELTSEKTEVCPQCELLISVSEVDNHKDFHMATKLQNSYISEVPAKTTSHKQSNKRSFTKKSSPAKKQATINQFFKPGSN